MPRKKRFSEAALDSAIAKSTTTKQVDVAFEKPMGERASLDVGAGVEHDGEKVDVEASVNVKTDFTKKKTSVGVKGSVKW